MPQRLAASEVLILPSFHSAYTREKQEGRGLGSLPKLMPLVFAAAMPSACRLRMFSPFALGYERQYLKNEVGNERAEKVLVLVCA